MSFSDLKFAQTDFNGQDDDGATYKRVKHYYCDDGSTWKE